MLRCRRQSEFRPCRSQAQRSRQQNGSRRRGFPLRSRALSMSARRFRQPWRTGASGDAGEKGLLDRGGVELATDEYEPTLAFFVRLPVALVIAVEHHVHALQHETLRIVLE